MPLLLTSYSFDETLRKHWRPYHLPRWPDNFIDSVFYLYPNKKAADRAVNVGACGFLVSVKWDHPRASPSSRHIYAVSNYHVAVRDSSVIRLNTRAGQSDVIETDPSEWFWQHGADVAIYRIESSKHFTAQTIWQYSHSFFDEVNCTEEVLREFQLGPGDDVVSVGRFVDVHGIQQNTPLIRSSIIASRGLVSVLTDPKLPWDREQCWIVEMRSRSGFSGSPVYVYIPPWQPNFIEARKRKYGSYFEGPWLLGVHSSQIPGDIDKDSPNAGMSAVVPCKALETLLVKDEKVRQERAAYEGRYIDVLTATSESSRPSGTLGNPQDEEDSTRLPISTARNRATDDQT